MTTLRAVVRFVARYQWHILAVGAIVAFGLGMWGFWIYYGAKEPFPLSDAIYWSVKGFLFASPVDGLLPWQLDVSRYLAPAVAGWAGLKTLGLVFRDRIQAMRIPLLRDHVVICGLGDYVGSVFVRHLREQDRTVVVVEIDPANPGIEVCRGLGVPVIIGDAKRSRTLDAAGVGRASRLLALTPNDAVNTQIVSAARELASDRRPAELRSLALITNPDFCQLLRVQEARRNDPDLSVDFFNIDEIGARLLLETHPVDPDVERPHIVVAHLDPLGAWLIYHAARAWHERRGDDDAKLVVTVLDDAAERRIAELLDEHAALEKVCRLEPLALTTRDVNELRAHHLDEATPPISNVYVTAYADAEAFETALKLQSELPSVPVTVAMSRPHGMAGLLAEAKEAGAAANVDVFLTMENTCTAELVRGGSFEPIARVIHDRWRSRERAAGRVAPTWDELDELKRESNRAQARHIPVKLRMIGCAIAPLRHWGSDDFAFTEEEIEELAIAEHDRWWQERIDKKWKRADVRNDARREHPDMVPFDELTEEVKDKDRDPVRDIPATLATVGLRVMRLPAHPA